jgi:hypothetical protein
MGDLPESSEIEQRIKMIQNCGDGEMHPQEYAFWMALPDFFKTVPQQCILSQMLWCEEGTSQLVIHMRIYDILRRLYFVQTQKEPSHNDVLKCMRTVMENKDLREFVMGFARSGTFPDTQKWQLLKN